MMFKRIKEIILIELNQGQLHYNKSIQTPKYQIKSCN